MSDEGTGIDEIAVLAAALEGFMLQRQKIDQQIEEVRVKLEQLGGRKAVRAAGVPRKRILSAAARKRIAMAQKKRWAEYRRKAQSPK